MKKYTIEIEYLQETKYCSAKPYEIELETDRIEWSMDQYQRNRQPFKWKIINFLNQHRIRRRLLKYFS